MATETPPEGTYEYLLKRDFDEDLSAHDNYIRDFDAYEAMLISKTYDALSATTKSGLTDSSSATLAIERAARVVGQLPSGTVNAAGKKDKGKGILMDIIRQKWIYPNANAQFPFLIKLRQWQLYSSVYGYAPMFYDWHISPTGYVGPDCWLWNPRNFVPQGGRNSIADMDYAYSLAFVGPKYIEQLLESDDEAGWDKTELEEMLSKFKNQTRETDTSRDSLVTRQRNTQATRQILLATRYEAGDGGKWCTFAPPTSDTRS